MERKREHQGVKTSFGQEEEVRRQNWRLKKMGKNESKKKTRPKLYKTKRRKTIKERDQNCRRKREEMKPRKKTRPKL